MSRANFAVSEWSDLRNY